MRCITLVCLMAATAAFRVTPIGVNRYPIVRGVSPEQSPHHISAAPHASGLSSRPRSATSATVTAVEAVVLPVAAVLAGSALLAVCSSTTELAQTIA